MVWLPPGGPLYEGDIEECNGKTRIVCPWHGYAFDVQTGMTDFGLPVSWVEALTNSDVTSTQCASTST